MSRTIIESNSPMMLDGFQQAVKFFVEEAYTQRLTRGSLLIEVEDDLPDMTYKLSKEDGLQVLYKGVPL